MLMEYSNGMIIADKVLNNLDKFVIDFIGVFENHSDYVIVSGYVSILLGRSRISEDVDLLFPPMPKDRFIILHEDLLKNGLWCLNGDNIDELYDLLDTRHSIRYGVNENPFPNMEIKFITSKIGNMALSQKIVVRLPSKDINISDLNIQVAFKEEALGSSKDKEDARHIRKTFAESIDEEKIQLYKKMLK
jgi:hypothetical protein